jgi:Tfp pilus assembly protein FimT
MQTPGRGCRVRALSERLIGGAAGAPGGSSVPGFSLIELVLVMAGTVMLAAISVPQVSNFLDQQRARDAARTVEREMQTARLKAVSASRSLRVRFNCPSIEQMRLLEVTGVAATDTASNRCSPTAYPYPPPNDSLDSTPSLDSPVIYLPSGTTVTGTALNFEFDPEGGVSTVSAAGVVLPLGGDVVLTVTRGRFSNAVTVNALGRVRLN